MYIDKLQTQNRTLVEENESLKRGPVGLGRAADVGPGPRQPNTSREAQCSGCTCCCNSPSTTSATTSSASTECSAAPLTPATSVGGLRSRWPPRPANCHSEGGQPALATAFSSAAAAAAATSSSLTTHSRTNDNLLPAQETRKTAGSPATIQPDPHAAVPTTPRDKRAPTQGMEAMPYPTTPPLPDPGDRLPGAAGAGSGLSAALSSRTESGLLPAHGSSTVDAEAAAAAAAAAMAAAAASQKEVAALQQQLAKARHELETATSDYQSCRKDFEILTRKYDSLMQQKLEVEEQRDRLFSPFISVELIREAMPSVDQALTALEQQLQEAREEAEMWRVEVEDSARGHKQQRAKWMQRLDQLQAVVREREERIRLLEQQLAGAAVHRERGDRADRLGSVGGALSGGDEGGVAAVEDGLLRRSSDGGLRSGCCSPGGYETAGSCSSRAASAASAVIVDSLVGGVGGGVECAVLAGRSPVTGGVAAMSGGVLEGHAGKLGLRQVPGVQ